MPAVVLSAQGARELPVAVSLDTPGMAVAAGYQLLAGRWINDADIRQRRNIAVVNESFARASFGSRIAIGKRFRLPGPATAEYEIAGLVADVRNAGLQQPVTPMVYVPLTGDSFSFVIVRSAGNIRTVLAQMPNELARLAPSLMLGYSDTLDFELERELGPHRFALAILSVFGGVGFLMVMVGLYGAMSYAVSRRTYEMGVRKALGAGIVDIVWHVTGRGLRTAAAGAIAGTLGSFFATRLLANQLGQTSRFDALTYALTILAMLAAVAAGMAAPTAKAILVDPLKSLRHE